jgi:uncharacterized protein (DUF1330 family)
MSGQPQIAESRLKAGKGKQMPKAYWIARVDVHDPELYKTYVETGRPAFARFGARFLARGGKTEILEGAARARNVVIEFASMQDAHDCYHSPEYTKAREYRSKAGVGEFILVEGIE